MFKATKLSADRVLTVLYVHSL